MRKRTPQQHRRDILELAFYAFMFWMLFACVVLILVWSRMNS